jgi:ribosome-binding factor A
MVTVTNVRVSPDLRNARVSVAHNLPDAKTREVLAALRHAEGFLRQQLAANLPLRFVPELSFHVDATDVYAQRVDQILDSIVASTHAQEGHDNRSATVPSDNDTGPCC